jgi:hypothetical protein
LELTSAGEKHRQRTNLKADDRPTSWSKTDAR